MANPHGTPIWYELLTTDHAVAKRFYDAVIGWRIGDRPAGEMDYRMIAASPDEPNDLVGGVMQLTDAMKSGGAQPGWLVYIGVDDIDATAARITQAGGAILMPPFDIPGAGRAALVADPQGAPFYIMRGASEESSTVFAPSDAPRPGRCSWNELWTPDAPAALAYYETVFGWTSPHAMPLGPGREYRFLHLGDMVLGALGPALRPEQPPRWTFYFQVADVSVAVATVTAEGGAITDGPHEVPGGSHVAIGVDPTGAVFAVVGPLHKGKEQ